MQKANITTLEHQKGKCISCAFFCYLNPSNQIEELNKHKRLRILNDNIPTKTIGLYNTYRCFKGWNKKIFSSFKSPMSKEEVGRCIANAKCPFWKGFRSFSGGWQEYKDGEGPSEAQHSANTLRTVKLASLSFLFILISIIIALYLHYCG